MLSWMHLDESSALTADKRRSELEGRSDCRFVKRDDFVRLLVSSEKLVRADEGPSGLRGLLDVRSNFRFLIEETELYSGESVPPQF